GGRATPGRGRSDRAGAGLHAGCAHADLDTGRGAGRGESVLEPVRRAQRGRRPEAMSRAALATPERTRLRVDGGWLAAVGVLILSAALSIGVMELPSNPLSDVVHYKYWTHQIATYGVSGAYSGEYPETAAIYPPVTMYGYRLAGWLYRHLYDP